VTDGCVIIANERGFGPLDPQKYQNYSIYEQESQALPGYNPNDEHAIFFPDPQGEDVVVAARDDFDTSDPYVLIQYQDQTQSGGGNSTLSVWSGRYFRGIRFQIVPVIRRRTALHVHPRA